MIPQQAIVKPVDTNKSGHNLDVIVWEQAALENEPLWKKRSTITQETAVQVVIEVMSAN